MYIGDGITDHLQGDASPDSDQNLVPNPLAGGSGWGEGGKETIGHGGKRVTEHTPREIVTHTLNYEKSEKLQGVGARITN